MTVAQALGRGYEEGGTIRPALPPLPCPPLLFPRQLPCLSLPWLPPAPPCRSQSQQQRESRDPSYYSSSSMQYGNGGVGGGAGLGYGQIAGEWGGGGEGGGVGYVQMVVVWVWGAVTVRVWGMAMT